MDSLGFVIAFIEPWEDHFLCSPHETLSRKFPPVREREPSIQLVAWRKGPPEGRQLYALIHVINAGAWRACLLCDPSTVAAFHWQLLSKLMWIAVVAFPNVFTYQGFLSYTHNVKTISYSWRRKNCVTWYWIFAASNKRFRNRIWKLVDFCEIWRKNSYSTLKFLKSGTFKSGNFPKLHRF